eukprot:1657800-Prymnesium_polylepis.1
MPFPLAGNGCGLSRPCSTSSSTQTAGCHRRRATWRRSGRAAYARLGTCLRRTSTGGCWRVRWRPAQPTTSAGWASSPTPTSSSSARRPRFCGDLARRWSSAQSADDSRCQTTRTTRSGLAETSAGTPGTRCGTVVSSIPILGW